MEGDGNCLFRAVACHLLHQISNGDSGIVPILSALGAETANLNESYLQQFLRTIMVKEWISNTECYQPFATVNLMSEAESFLNSGQFGGELGDLMVVTLSNILNYPIAIFTSVANMPLLCITPLGGGPGASTSPLFLTFIQSGPGHYDYAVSIDSTATNPEKKVKCTCGRKRDYKGKACSTPRCACVIASTGCTSLCTCKCCTNDNGKRPPPSSKRNRAMYADSKSQPLAGSSVNSFLVSTGEELTQGYLTLLEDILLKCMLVYFIINDIELSPNKLQQYYSTVYSLTKLCKAIDFPLLERSTKDIEDFLKKVCKSISYY